MKLGGLKIVESFVTATEHGDANAAMRLCTEDLVYKTHRQTTTSLAGRGEAGTKVPKPAKVTKELHEEKPGLYVREVVVKPVPFVTVTIVQEFELRHVDNGDVKLCRAEYIKQ